MNDIRNGQCHANRLSLSYMQLDSVQLSDVAITCLENQDLINFEESFSQKYYALKICGELICTQNVFKMSGDNFMI